MPILNRVQFRVEGLTVPSIPDGPEGPETLADVIIGACSSVPHLCRPKVISDSAIRELVSLAYYSSLMPEESHYPRYRIVVTLSENTFFRFTQFEPVSLSCVDQLRKLAPILANTDDALLVVPKEEQLILTGIVSVGSLGMEFRHGYPGVVGVGHTPRFSIEVFGPGHIRVDAFTACQFEIRAGRIRPTYPYYGPAPVRSLLQQLQSRVTREVTPRLETKAEDFRSRIVDDRPLLFVLSTILRVCADAGRGGGFIFLPASSGNVIDYKMRILTKAMDLDIGAILVDHWANCLLWSAETSSEKREAEAGRSEVLRNKVQRACEITGGLSLVDGFVVITNEFRVCGFGTKIDVSPKDANESPRRFKHIATEETFDDETFMREIGGTRHQSAARFCQYYPHAIAFVVSQDGVLKVFCSDEENAFAFGPLDLPTISNSIHL